MAAFAMRAEDGLNVALEINFGLRGASPGVLEGQKQSREEEQESSDFNRSSHVSFHLLNLGVLWRRPRSRRRGNPFGGDSRAAVKRFSQEPRTLRAPNDLAFAVARFIT